VAGFYEHGNERSGFIIGEEVFDWMRDYQLLKNGCSACGYQMLPHLALRINNTG
jgi:hypothetical protein